MIELLDSTLREGEQTPGVNFTIDQKVEIATLLDEFGIDIIEAGHPAVSQDIRKAVKKITSMELNAAILAHSRALRKDIDNVIDCGADWVGIFLCVSEKALRERFGTDLDSATRKVVDAVEYAKDHGLKVRYTPEDSFRTEPVNLEVVTRAAVEAGAGRISLADTVGIMTPRRMHDFVTMVREFVDVPLHVHCHNDLGLATANSLAAVEAGVQLVDVTVNGLGERTGIAPLAEIAVALKLLHDEEREWDLSLLQDLSGLVERHSGIPIHRQAPVTGENAFTHNAGLHVSAVMKDPGHYESIPMEAVGRFRTFVLDRMAGRDTLRLKLREWNMTLNESQLEQLQCYIDTAPILMDACGSDFERRVCEYAKQLERGSGLLPSDHHALHPGAQPMYRNASAGMIFAAPFDGPMVQMKVNR